MKIAVAQLGARMHYAVARIFHQGGMLERFFTDSYVGNKPWLEAVLRALPQGVRPRAAERWLGRKDSTLPPDKVASLEALGFAYARAQRKSSPELDRAEVSRSYGLRFQQAILRRGLGRADTLYAMQGAADLLLAHAKDRGMLAIYEQFGHTRRYAKRLIELERERLFGQSRSNSLTWTDADEHLLQSEHDSINNADIVIVASDCTRRSMIENGSSVANIKIVPYGIDLSRWRPAPGAATRAPGPLRVLYVGAVTPLKGVIYLLQAVQKIGPGKIDLKIAGSVALPETILRPYNAAESFLGPVPRLAVQQLFQWADLFVFPTLGEGFGLVQVEAIACGTPVIATTECGEVVREGVEGHIVPPRDPEAIAKWLDHYAADPKRLEPLRAAALERAQYFSLDAYAERLLAVVGEPDRGNRTNAAA